MNTAAFHSFFFVIISYLSISIAPLQQTVEKTFHEYNFDQLEAQFNQLRYQQPEKARKVAQVLLEKAVQENNPNKIAIAHQHLAYSELYLENKENALFHANKSLLKALAANRYETYANSLNLFGNIYFNSGEYTEAVTYYLKVDSIADVLNDVNLKIKSYHNIGLVKIETSDFENAISLFEKKLDAIENLSRSQEKDALKLNTYIALSVVYLRYDPSKVSKYVTPLKELSVLLNDDDGLSYYYIVEAISFYQDQSYPEALKSLKIAEALVEKLGTRSKMFTILTYRGNCFFEMGQIEKAIKTYEQINDLRSSVTFNNLDMQLVYSRLAKSYEKLGKGDEALFNYKKALRFAEENEAIKTTINNEQLAQYNVSKLMDKINELSVSGDEKSFRIKMLIAVIIFLLLLLGAATWLFKNKQRKNIEMFHSVVNEIEKPLPTTKDDSSESNQVRQVPENIVKEIMKGLKTFEAEHLFLNPDSTLASTAQYLGTNTSYLSKVINTQKRQSFKSYIKSLRINHGLKKLKNEPIFRSYTIKAIALELGFKSEDAFSKSFKQQTGLYPSFFIKTLNKQSENDGNSI
ncbi:helix-turn-helix domain-containing protein [Flavobacteriaceae bacterium M23B6Z8]